MARRTVPFIVLGALVVVSTGAAIVGARGSPGAPPTTTSTTGRPPSASTTSTTTARASYGCGVVPNPEVVITSNTPCSIITRVGDTVHVVLNPGLRWSTPMSDSTAVVVANVQRQSMGGLDADLIAARAGQATVTAMGTALCPPGGVCPQFIVLWRLHVTVGTVLRRQRSSADYTSERGQQVAPGTTSSVAIHAHEERRMSWSV